MTPKDAATLVARIRTYWPNHHLDVDKGFLAKAWAEAMYDITLDEAVHAVLTITRRGDRFPPPVSVIVDVVRQERHEQDGTRPPDPDEALAMVYQAVRRWGIYQGPPPDWPHPAVGAAVDAIGWREVCLSEDPGVLRGQFLKVYETARQRHTRMATSDDVRALTAGRLTPELPEG